MSTDSVPPFSRASSPSRRIADVVYDSLKTALEEQCTRRYAEDMVLRRLDRTSANELMRLQLECSDVAQTTIHVKTAHVGGNVYEVACEIEDGPSRHFSCSLPGGAEGVFPKAPRLGQKLGRFILDALEQRLGRRLLRGEEPSPDTDRSAKALE